MMNNKNLAKRITERVMEKIKSGEFVETINYRGNFIAETKGFTYNEAPLVSINETNAKRLLNRHTKDGYIAISPCRGFNEFGINSEDPDARQKLAAQNAPRIKECAELIRQSGFSYTPVYGGFKEELKNDSDKVVGYEDVFEKSFIVYPYDRNGNLQPFENLKSFAIELAARYNQDSVFIVAPNSKPTYYDKNGNKDFELGDNVAFNDLSQEYFTDLNKSAWKSGLKGKPSRFSYVEAYINPSPACLSEAHVRHLKGEKFLSYLS
ncbi:MAG: hypothetical protein LUD72_04055 [Bacteroidales bacterium]|nr:hypothetical protein [Bacteroidales bacterium]